MTLRSAAFVAVLAASACASSQGAAEDVGPFDRLSQYGLLDDGHAPRDGVVRYEIENALFADGATKMRAVRVAGRAQYEPSRAFDFPVGTIAVKSFGFPAADGATRWLETRLLVHAQDGWHGYVYLWDESQRDATRISDGAVVDVATRGGSITWHVPKERQCNACHGDVIEPIGLRAEELNTEIDGEEQLARWSARGLVEGVPPLGEVPRAPVWDDPRSGSVADRARAYLDANCAHCHSPTGHASFTGLFLGRHVDGTPGACVPSGKADTPFLVAPGEPDRSYLLARLHATSPAEMMPPLGRSTVDADGAALVAAWIRETPGRCAE